MANFYYSGQGSLMVAQRDETTGKPMGFLKVGNVPELTINIETSKLEHKESESGARLTDVTIVTEKKGSFEFTLENLDLDNMALGLWGTKATVAGGTVSTGTPEVIAIPQAVAGGMRFPLTHPKVSAVTVKDAAGTATLVAGTDYILDAANGVIEVVTGGAIATAAASAATTIKVEYTYAGYKKVDAFTQAAAPVRWLRFEGINTVDGSTVIVDMFKAQFDPLTGYSLINEELASIPMKGAILADAAQTGPSKFFRQINV